MSSNNEMNNDVGMPFIDGACSKCGADIYRRLVEREDGTRYLESLHRCDKETKAVFSLYDDDDDEAIQEYENALYYRVMEDEKLRKEYNDDAFDFDDDDE